MAEITWQSHKRRDRHLGWQSSCKVWWQCKRHCLCSVYLYAFYLSSNRQPDKARPHGKDLEFGSDFRDFHWCWCPSPEPTVTRALLTLSKLIKACAEGSTELAGGNARIVEYLEQVKPRIDAYYTALCRPREHHDPHVKHEQNATIPALAILRHIQRFEFSFLAP